MNNDSSLRPSRIVDLIDLYVLPFGIFVLLTGLFWLGDKSAYIKLYYVLVVVPTCVMIWFKPAFFKRLVHNPLILTFIVFGLYSLLTLFWSDTDHSILSLIRRPFNIFILFLAFGYQITRPSRSLFAILTFSAKVAAICGVLSLLYFYYTHHSGFLLIGRFSGYGALFNPLLTSHIYGFFTVFWLAVWFSQREQPTSLPLLPLACLLLVIVSTGSRTPQLAIFVTLGWLCFCTWNRRSVIALCLTLSIIGVILYFSPGIITQRGLSYRPDIWMQAVTQALEAPWFGHGFDHILTIEISSISQVFYDPHNIELAVLLSGGVIGLVLWLALYAIALFYSWRHRDNCLVVIASALIVYGFVAGLTEGRSFISRPKVHWFLIWIPFALLSAVWIYEDRRNAEAAQYKSELPTMSE